MEEHKELTTPAQVRTQRTRKVFCWGKNKHGELSVVHTKPVLKPVATKGVGKYRVEYVTSGGSHSSFVTESGKILLCGSTLHGTKDHLPPSPPPSFSR